MLELRNVSVSFKQDHESFSALRNINLKVENGECLAVVGGSGCGKTTLLTIMAGLNRPTEGEVLYNDTELEGSNNDIAVVFQNYGLFPWKTVRENILLPLKLKHQKSRYREADDIIDRLGLEEHADKFPCQLSGGQKQRVAIGRALLTGCRMILMDEPFSALDPRSKDRIRENIRRLLEEKHMTSVIVTHNVKEAVLFGDRIAVFANEGKVIREVIGNEVERETGCEKTEEFQEMQSYLRERLTGGVDED